MRIGIVGGGLMGLALADHLAGDGHRVSVFERGKQLGGLTTWHDFGQFVWDRFYHVVLPTDAALLGLMKRIGLEDRMRWGATQTGYYVDSKFYPLSNNVDFLKFPPLNLWNKFRLAATILYCARISDWRSLEKITVEDFLRRTSGNATFEKFWKPLLLAKLGEQYKRVSAVFIWSYIKRMFSARDAAASKEQLGHISGGYRAVFQRLRERIEATGGSVATDVEVTRVEPREGGGVSIRVGSQVEHFDKVIFTGPVNVMRQTVAESLVELPVQGKDVEYLGVVCMVLVTKRPLMPYYILNIGDERIPFTGIIGMSNLVSTQETAGLHFSYLPKYVLSDDPILQKTDEELRALFLNGLRQMFPDFSESDIESAHINRAIKVQPLQVLNYSSLVQQPRTRHQDFYVVNTAQFVNNTLNNNQVIQTVNGFLDQYGKEFARVQGESAEAVTPVRVAAGGR
ncbi:protoporphyrinogen oxidase [Povalibacter uvarum]|uniref:Protoporphyrinogen oxidase n=1 Tax=Povalibacter uvarum TaxID=732238 RepID=A0A841HHF9_9GAMM|nr:NAD(P)/FAD-dependent oxidoreductase [Povalibacter uvarum]MBB6091652.1 protoporphyrinogen oxidase [Povalibacter uvarum]